MSGEKIFRYHKVELDDENDTEENPSKSKPDFPPHNYNTLKKARVSSYKITLTLIFVIVLISVTTFSVLAYENFNKRVDLSSPQNHTTMPSAPSPIKVVALSTFYPKTTTRHKKGTTAPQSKPNTTVSTTTTSTTLNPTSSSEKKKPSTVASSATTKNTVSELSKEQWYLKYWRNYANRNRWDWMFLGLVAGISSMTIIIGVACIFCICRSRKRIRKRHFERLLKDINATEKFSLVTPSEEEDDEEEEEA